MIRYSEAIDVCMIVEHLVGSLPEYFSHIDPARIKCFRSWGARTNAVARIHGLPRIWLTALKIKPQYIIEVISENYDHLSSHEKIKVIIHELLHIPKGFTGGLRPHGKYVNERLVNSIYRLLKGRDELKII